MKLTKRGDVWQVRFYVDGDEKPIRKSTGERDKKRAAVRAREIIAEYLSGGPKPSGTEAVTVAKGFARCHASVWADIRRSRPQVLLTRQIEKYRLQGRTVGETPLRQIDYDWLLELKASLESDGLAAGTVRNWFVPLKVLLKEAVHWKAGGVPVVMQVPKFPKFTVENTKDRVVSPEEEQRLLSWLDEKAPSSDVWWLMRRYVPILMDTGARRSELLCDAKGGGLRWDDVRVDHLLFRETKNGKPRSVPVTERARRALLEIRNTQRLGQAGPFPLSGSAVTHRMREALDAVELKDVNVHTFRHTCATRLLQGGMDLYRVSKWLGHSSVVVTEKRYAHLIVEDLMSGTAVLEGTRVESA